MRVVAEAYLHNDASVAAYAERAVKIADELQLSDEDRAALLPKIVEMLGAKQVIFEQASALPLIDPRGPRG